MLLLGKSIVLVDYVVVVVKREEWMKAVVAVK